MFGEHGPNVRWCDGFVSAGGVFMVTVWDSRFEFKTSLIKDIFTLYTSHYSTAYVISLLTLPSILFLLQEKMATQLFGIKPTSSESEALQTRFGFLPEQEVQYPKKQAIVSRSTEGKLRVPILIFEVGRMLTTTDFFMRSCVNTASPSMIWMPTPLTRLWALNWLVEPLHCCLSFRLSKPISTLQPNLVSICFLIGEASMSWIIHH